MDYVLNKEAGSSDNKFQNHWMRDCDPKTGKVLRGEMREMNSYIRTSMYIYMHIHLQIWPTVYTYAHTHTHILKDKAYIHTCIHTHTHTHIHFKWRTHTHTHTHPPTHSLCHTQVLESRQVDDPDAPGGKRSKRLSDFMEHPIARFCQLTEAEVFALRFYTTAGYKGINWQDFFC